MNAAIEITDFLTTTYGLSPPLQVTPIDHDGWNRIFRVEGDGAWALRLSHRRKTRRHLTFELALLATLSDRLPYVPTVRRTVNGTLYATLAGAYTTLFAWMPGVPLGLGAKTLTLAGRVLGQMHGELARLAPGHRYVGDLSLLAFDWTDNTMARGDVLSASGAAPPAALAPELAFLRAARAQLEDWLVHCRDEHRFGEGVTHGDFYRGNLLVREGAISAVLDWDEATTSWVAYEVANATWEFARDDRRAVLDRRRRRLFRDGYASAHPLPALTPVEEARLIAVRRLIEIQHALFEHSAGRDVDLDYAVLNLRYLQRLLAGDL